MKTLLSIFALLPVILCGQVYFDFESGSLDNWIFNNPGRWECSEVEPLSGERSLHHIFDNPVSDIDIAAISIDELRADMGNVTWRFTIRHGSDPSSSNNWGLFLAADAGVENLCPGNEVSGFVVGVNMSGYDDTLRLWKISRGALSQVITTEINWQIDIGTSGMAEIVVSRQPTGDWDMDVGINGAIPTLAGKGGCPDWYTASLLGICYRYTSTRDRLLWLDNLSVDGVFETDTEPPLISDVRFESPEYLVIVTNEPLSAGSLASENFSLGAAAVHPLSVSATGSVTRLLFSEPFENKEIHNLVIISLCDLKGNCSERLDTAILLLLPEWGDLVITEFMSDPDPAVDLPPYEYVEIYNRSAFLFTELHLTLEIGSGVTSIFLDSFYPDEYLLVAGAGWEDGIIPEIRVADIPLKGSLNNYGASILLSDSKGNTLHGLTYNTGWFNDKLKSEGGWSFEMKDYKYPFQNKENWAFSISPHGGTPGKPNSVRSSNPDNNSPWPDAIYAISDSTISLMFSEPVNAGDFPPSDWILTEAGTGRLERSITSVTEAGNMKMEYLLTCTPQLQQGVLFNLIMPAIADYGGNRLIRYNMGTGLTATPGWNDIVFNEILFHPLSGEAEYIEIFNSSDMVVDPSSLFLVSLNEQSGDTGKPVRLSSIHRSLMPGDYYTVTSDRESILRCYPDSYKWLIYELSGLPSLPDKGGTLLLLTSAFELVDRLVYNENMHLDILSGAAGVALERINPSAPSSESSSWHSAAGTSGWGTPGSVNSMFIADPGGGKGMRLSSSRVSPDNDGFEDIIQVTVTTDLPGVVITCIIFNEAGIPVRHLAENLTGSGNDHFYWDGTDDSGITVLRGLYIVYARLTGMNGKIQSFKKVCAVIYR